MSARPASPLAGGIAGSASAVKKELARAGSGSNTRKLLLLQSDTPTKVRLLQEPEEWMVFYEHFVPAMGERKAAYVPALDPDPLANHPDEKVRRTSLRHMVNVLDLSTMTIKLLKMNQDLTNRFMVRHGRYGTVTDRSYEILRQGSGFNITHDLEADEPTLLDISRFRPKFHDMQLFLLQAADTYHDTDHAEEYVRSTGQQETAPLDDDNEEHRRDQAAREEALTQARLAREAEAAAKYGSPDDVSHLAEDPAPAPVAEPVIEPTPQPEPEAAAGPAPVDALRELREQLAAAEAQLAAQVTPRADPTAVARQKAAERAAAAKAAATAPAPVPSAVEVGVPWEEPDEDQGIPAGAPPAAAEAGVAPQPAQALAEATPAQESPQEAAEDDEWAQARAQGRPCEQGPDDNCTICGFPLDGCLVK